MSDVEWIGARCSVCNGPVIQSTTGSGFGNPVYVHANDADWQDSPHDVVLAEPADIPMPEN